MSLRLRTSTKAAVFLWEDGPMKAQWELSTSMDEGQLTEVLLSMMKFVRAQPGDADIIPLHVVPDNVFHMPSQPIPGTAHVPAPMTWTAAIKPKPLDDSLQAAGQNGFELIPEDELGD